MMVHRLPRRLYASLVTRVVALPLASGIALSFSLRARAGLSALVLVVAVALAVYASHWIGWLRSPVVVHDAPMKTRTRTMLALVLLLALPLTACPPGDKPDEPEPESAEKGETPPAAIESAPADEKKPAE